MKNLARVFGASIVALATALPQMAMAETLVYEGFSANDYKISSVNLVATGGPTAAKDSVDLRAAA